MGKGEEVNERMSSTRNKKKVKCLRCGKNIFFSREDIYQDDRDNYIDCPNCGHSTKLRKIK